MVNLILERDQVRIPSWVNDLDSFRRWTAAGDFPEKGRIWYHKSEVWVDMSKEQVFTHALVKTEVGYTLTGLTKADRTGIYLVDGAYLTNEAADLSTKADGLYVSNESLRTGRVKLVEGIEEGIVELEGSPDMALEVVSTGSVRKDTVILRRAYWEAGVREYWLIDARKPPLKFDILRHTARRFVIERKSDGWVRSAVFERAFRLTQQADALGNPQYTLEAR